MRGGGLRLWGGRRGIIAGWIRKGRWLCGGGWGWGICWGREGEKCYGVWCLDFFPFPIFSLNLVKGRMVMMEARDGTEGIS